MRTVAISLALLMTAVPAAAQPAAPAARDPSVEAARHIADPATADKLANMMQSLGKAVLDLPVGELQAAVEGRVATHADRRLTVRDVGRRDDPDFDRKFAARMAQARPMVQQSLRAISAALPAITQSLRQASEAVERAAANMPDPTYPKR